MQSMNGWEKAKKTKRIEDYGIQKCRVCKDVDIEEIDTDNDEVLPWFCKQRYVSIKYLNVTKYLKYGRLVTPGYTSCYSRKRSIHKVFQDFLSAL